LNAETFEYIVQTHSPTLLRTAFLYLKSTAEAEDVVQEVFIKYWQKNPHFRNEAARKAWLYKATVNLCKDHLKSFWRTKRVELKEDISYLPSEEHELLQSLMQLDEKYRIPLHLYYYEGYSIKEISEILRMRSSTVGSRLHRGKEQLRIMLGGTFDETL